MFILFSAILIGPLAKINQFYTSINVHALEYSKTCLKGPLQKKTKNWFSRPIIA